MDRLALLNNVKNEVVEIINMRNRYGDSSSIGSIKSLGYIDFCIGQLKRYMRQQGLSYAKYTSSEPMRVHLPDGIKTVKDDNQFIRLAQSGELILFSLSINWAQGFIRNFCGAFSSKGRLAKCKVGCYP